MSPLDDFFVRAVLAALGAAIICAPLGCFLIWRRMAFYGDATAHGALLGVAGALLLQLPIWLGALCAALIMAFGILGLSHRKQSADTVMSVLTHASLAISLLALSLASGPRFDLEGLLFGDILAVSKGDLALIWAGGLAVAAVLLMTWSNLLLATLSPELAQASGINPRRAGLILMVLLGTVVALSIEIVGALLVSSLMIIPAASARVVTKTPEHMAALAAFLGVFAAMAGLALSWYADAPAGPAIVASASVIYALSQILRLGLKA